MRLRANRNAVQSSAIAVILTSAHHIPDDRQRDDQQYGEDGAPTETVHVMIPKTFLFGEMLPSQWGGAFSDRACHPGNSTNSTYRRFR
jgi:hypothetical protein